MEGDEKTGGKIILKALEAPLFHIVSNAGLEGAVIVNKVKELPVGQGFDAYNEIFVDMIWPLIWATRAILRHVRKFWVVWREVVWF